MDSHGRQQRRDVRGRLWQVGEVCSKRKTFHQEKRQGFICGLKPGVWRLRALLEFLRDFIVKQRNRIVELDCEIIGTFDHKGRVAQVWILDFLFFNPSKFEIRFVLT